MLYRFFAVFIGILLYMCSHAAVDPYEFASEDDRKRYHTLVEELRCPKCKNNNLAGTNSQIAVDLRRELQKMVTNGDSDEQIIDFMVSRYGDFVLYRPRMSGKTLFVWLGPLVFLFIGLSVVVMVTSRRRKVSPSGGQVLTEEEELKLQEILSKKHPDDPSSLGGRSQSDKNNTKK